MFYFVFKNKMANIAYSTFLEFVLFAFVEIALHGN